MDIANPPATPSLRSTSSMSVDLPNLIIPPNEFMPPFLDPSAPELTVEDLVCHLPSNVQHMLLDKHLDPLLLGPAAFLEHLRRTKSLDAVARPVLGRRLLYLITRRKHRIDFLESLAFPRTQYVHGSNPQRFCLPDEYALAALAEGLPSLRHLTLEESAYNHVKWEVEERIDALSSLQSLSLESLSVFTPLPHNSLTPQHFPLDIEHDFFALTTLQRLPLSSFQFNPEDAKPPILKAFLLQGANVLKNATGVTNMAFSGYKDGTKKLSSISRSLSASPLVKNLLVLTLKDCALLPRCFDFLASLSRLTSLTLQSLTVEVPPPALGLPLSVSNLFHSAAPSLRHLALESIAFHPSLTPSIAWASLRHLRSLSVRLSPVANSAFSLQGLSHLSNLHTLALLGGIQEAHLPVVPTFAGLKALRSLTLTKFPATLALPALRVLPHPHRMQAVDLNLLPHARLVPQDLDVFLTAATRLTCLRLRYNPLIPSPAALEGLTRLRDLTLSTPAAYNHLSAIATSCASQLTRLELSVPPSTAGPFFHREVLPRLMQCRELLIEPGCNSILLSRAIEAGQLRYLERVRVRDAGEGGEEALESAYLRSLQPCLAGELVVERAAVVRPREY